MCELCGRPAFSIWQKRDKAVWRQRKLFAKHVCKSNVCIRVLACLPHDRLAEVLLGGDDQNEYGEDHDRVAVIVAVNDVVVVLVHKRANLFQDCADHHL